ncbi:hypothetical protein BDQ12DRAFT_723757 [Crucibulum laeve]|uniref:Uncharacterized protein n=1 Tax=Crucibulum laeve TaxID=68775 RepID=A0A5C3LYH5_9AGAR|nr:hypothetical protein BDQ12DRAFT_723757 [Crucibulum laeve]
MPSKFVALLAIAAFMAGSVLSTPYDTESSLMERDVHDFEEDMFMRRDVDDYEIESRELHDY